jgi:hypothetical protein
MTVIEFPVPRQQVLQSKFICSACGADRDCQCTAPAVERLAQKQEQDRQRSKAYRERKTEENQTTRHVTETEERDRAECVALAEAACRADPEFAQWLYAPDAAAPATQAAPITIAADDPAASAAVMRAAHAANEIADQSDEQLGAILEALGFRFFRVLQHAPKLKAEIERRVLAQHDRRAAKPETPLSHKMPKRNGSPHTAPFSDDWAGKAARQEFEAAKKKSTKPRLRGRIEPKKPKQTKPRVIDATTVQP